MESVSKTFKNLGKSIFPKSVVRTKTRKVKFNKSSQSSASKSRSKSRHTSSNSFSPTLKFRKSFKKFHKKYQKDSINVDHLVKTVDTLHSQAHSLFKKKKKATPDSPLILTVKNLDTGKTANATIIKDLDTGKYEFYKLTGSK